ncbi:putative transmembrane protein, partial [Toxoplasma gondii MAS]
LFFLHFSVFLSFLYFSCIFLFFFHFSVFLSLLCFSFISLFFSHFSVFLSQRWGTPERGAPSRGSGDLPGNISSGRQGAEGSSQSPPAPGRGSLLESPRLHRLLPSLFDLSLPPSRRFSLASLLGERSVLGEDENTEETRRAEESDKADCGEEDEGDRAGGRERVGDARQGDERRQGERREEVGASGSKFSSDKLNFCLSRGDGREERDGAFLSSSSNGRSLRLSDLDGGGDEELKPTQKLGLPDTTTSADPRESAASPAKAPPVEKRSLSCSFETSKSVSSRSHLAFSQALPSGQAGEGERKERGAKVGDGSLHFFDPEREGTAAVSAEKLVLQWREVNAANCKQQKRTAQASLARVETLRETARRARAEFLLHAEETPGSLSRLWGETNEATSFSETRDERRRENDQTAEGRDAREKRQEVLERILNAASLSEAPQRRQRPREDERGTDRDNPGRGEETPGLFDRLRLRPQTHPSREEETFSLRNLASTRRR